MTWMRLSPRLLLAFLLGAPLLQGQAPPYVAPQDPAVQQKLAWWQGLKFGLFMHWGPYSQWGVVESWSICPEDEAWTQRTGPSGKSYFEYKAAYEKLGRTFNPTRFDPSKWARAAREAGMKYVVFTTKHHDGFCMFDTAVTSYKVTDPSCPFSADPRANIAKGVFSAFRQEGFGIGAYFSKPDWHSENYWWSYFPPKDRNANYAPAKYPDRWKAFSQYTRQQIEELMTGYGKVDILWLDGGWVQPPREDLDMNGIAAMARKHQPGLIVVDREVHGENENYRTPEQQVPPKPLAFPWETCMTMGDSWSYVPKDNYKSAQTLIQQLCRIVSRGGNFLLNIGPGPEGDFDPVAYERLREVGAWMKVNGEAIYESRPVAPYESGDMVFTARADGHIYAIQLAKEDGSGLPERVVIPAEVTGRDVRISLLGHSGQLDFHRTAGGPVEVLIPAKLRLAPPSAHAWVFRITPGKS